MKMIKVRFIGCTWGKGKAEFWVKETNPYFNWYRKSKCYKVLKEKTLEGKK